MTQHFQWPQGVKKTRRRQAVAQILMDASEPLSALDIHKRLTEREGEAVWLSTVYRILGMFTEKGVIIKTSVPGSDRVFYEPNRPMHRHYAVCVDCRKLVTLDNCPMADFEPKLSDERFRVVGHRVEMYGYCRDCDKRKI